MTLFEFVTVIISMILALSVGNLLLGTAALVKKRRQVRMSAIHALWTLTLLTLPLSFWWSLWDLLDQAWTFPQFCYAVLGPIALFFATAVFMPDATGEEEIDLEAHFFGVRPIFLGTLLGYLVVTWFDGYLLAGLPWAGAVGRVNMIGVTTVLIGLATKNRLYHLCASALLVGMFFFLLLARYLPGSGA